MSQDSIVPEKASELKPKSATPTNEVKNEIVVPSQKPMQERKIEPVVQRNSIPEATTLKTEMPPKDLRGRLLDKPSGNFTEIVSQDKVSVELKSLMSQFANAMGDLRVDVTPNNLGQGWRVKGSNTKQSFAMSLVPDQNSGFNVKDIDLSGFGLKGMAIKALLSPDLILSELNKNLPKYLPGINISKLTIGRDGSLTISGSKK